LSIVERLRGVSFVWRPRARTPEEDKAELPTIAPPPGRHFGLIAQEVEKVAPEAVVGPASANGYYGLDEASLVPVLIEAVKAEQAEIGKLQDEVARLESKKR
ncbi:MAG: tail fiber domain-containing protein, partial [Caulobacteraceae bacterium]